jgi:hypothetical protein
MMPLNPLHSWLCCLSMGQTTKNLGKLLPDLPTKTWTKSPDQDQQNPLDPTSPSSSQYGFLSHLEPWDDALSHQSRPRDRLPTQRMQRIHVHQCNTDEVSLLQLLLTDVHLSYHLWQSPNCCLWSNDSIWMHDPISMRRSQQSCKSRCN